MMKVRDEEKKKRKKKKIDYNIVSICKNSEFDCSKRTCWREKILN